VLTALAVSQAVVRHRAGTEDPLQGDAEEASSGLMTVLRKTPVEQRVALLRSIFTTPTRTAIRGGGRAWGTGKSRRGGGHRKRVHGFGIHRAAAAMESLLKIAPERGMRLLLIGLNDEDKWIQERRSRKSPRHCDPSDICG